MSFFNKLAQFFGKKDTTQASQPTTPSKPESFFSGFSKAMTKPDQFQETKKLAKDTAGFFADVVRAVPRATVSVASSLSPKNVVENSAIGKFDKTTGELTPDNKVSKFILGKKPIRTQQKQNENTNKVLQEYGVTPSVSKGISPLIVGAGTLLDLTPFGSEKKVATKLIEAKTAEEAAQILRMAKAPEEFITKNAERFAKETDPKVIESLLKQDVPTTHDNYFLNTGKLNVPQESKEFVQTELNKLRTGIEKDIGEKITNKDIVTKAKDIENATAQFVTKEEQESFLANALKLKQELAATAKEGKLTPGFIEAVKNAKAMSTMSGRLLQAQKIVADPATSNIMRKMVEDIDRLGFDMDEVLKAADGIDFNNADEAAKFYREFVKPRAETWVDLLRYNSMLSNPLTQIVNTTSNLFGATVVKPLVKATTGVVDKIRSVLSNTPQEQFTSEAGSYIKGFASKDALSKAWTDFKDVMKGKMMPDNIDLKKIPLATEGPKKALANVLEFPMKLMEASDRFMSALVESGEKKSLVYRQTRSGKLNPNIAEQAKDEAAKVLFRSALTDEKNGPLLNSIGGVAEKLQQMRNSQYAPLRWMSKLTIPFVHTGTNIIKQSIEFSPVTGLFTAVKAANKSEQIAKWAIGTAATLATASLVGNDRVTFSEPRDAKSKADFRAAGMQPYSIKIGDKWFSYQRLHPAIAFNMALTAALKDRLSDKTIDDSTASRILSAFAKYGTFISEQSYLKNIGDFVAGTQGDEDAWTQYFSNYPQQFVPFKSLLGWVEKLTDPVQRQADPKGTLLEKQMQQFMSQIPWAAQNYVPPRLDNDGNPIPNTDRVTNAFSPSRVKTQTEAQKEDYDTITRLKETNAKSAKAKAEKKDQVNQFLDSVKTMTPEEKKAELTRLASENPNIVGDIKRELDARKKNFTSIERRIYALDVKNGERAAFIADEVKRFKTPQEKKDYIKNLVAKGIITNEVAKQLAQLIAKTK